MEQRSPYAPPASALEVLDERKGAIWKAVSLGLLVDYGGTMVAGILFVVIAAALMAANDAGSFEFEVLLEDPLSPVMVGIYMIGTMFSALGGYVCARIAKHSELKLGMVLATLSTLFGLLLDDETTGVGLDLVLYSAGIAAIVLGSWMGMKRNERHRPRT